MHQCFLMFTRWSQTSRSSRTGAECSRHRDNHMGSISWRETGRPSALHGDEEGLHQANVADGGWPFVQQQIHSYQHLARKRIQLQSVREERYRPFRAICVSSLGNNKKEGFVDRFIFIIALKLKHVSTLWCQKWYFAHIAHNPGNVLCEGNERATRHLTDIFSQSNLQNTNSRERSLETPEIRALLMGTETIGYLWISLYGSLLFRFIPVRFGLSAVKQVLNFICVLSCSVNVAPMRLTAIRWGYTLAVVWKVSYRLLLLGYNPVYLMLNVLQLSQHID